MPLQMCNCRTRVKFLLLNNRQACLQVFYRRDSQFMFWCKTFIKKNAYICSNIKLLLSNHSCGLRQKSMMTDDQMVLPMFKVASLLQKSSNQPFLFPRKKWQADEFTKLQVLSFSYEPYRCNVHGSLVVCSVECSSKQYVVTRCKYNQ